jgi:hypothetical protein
VNAPTGQPAASQGEGEVVRIANLEIRPMEFQVLAEGRRVGLTVAYIHTHFGIGYRFSPERVTH